MELTKRFKHEENNIFDAIIEDKERFHLLMKEIDRVSTVINKNSEVAEYFCRIAKNVNEVLVFGIILGMKMSDECGTCPVKHILNMMKNGNPGTDISEI